MTTDDRIYLDNHATTRCDPRVVEAMLPWFSQDYGNPSSRQHAFGRRAREAVERARGQVAECVGASPREIVFTSGATEAINLALIGGVEARTSEGAGVLVVTVETEHAAVLDTCEALAGRGVEVVRLPVDAGGLVAPQAVADALGSGPALVAVMAANNEIGTLQPLPDISRVCRDAGAWLFSDASQAIGRVPFRVDDVGVDLASLSAHKVYGPKGVGALYVRRRDPRVDVRPQVHGGGHERGRRSGTLNVPGIVGLGAACALAMAHLDDEAARVGALRDRLLAALVEALPAVAVNGALDPRLPGNLNVSFAGVEGEALMMGLRGVAASSGSACTTERLTPSHVLRAIGIPEDLVYSSLRFGIGRFNTADEIDEAARRIVATVRRLRDANPRWPR